MGGDHLSGHALSRLNVLCGMVSSILVGGRTDLSRMALSSGKRTKLASRKKQFKRWLINERNTYTDHYLPYAEAVLKSLALNAPLIFSIDGSTVGKGCICLMFSVIYKGRVIPVVWHVHKGKKGHLPESAHRELLAALADIIPDGCRVVITGDGEFDGCDRQKDILSLGWDYVVKTGKGTCVTEASGDTFKPGDVRLIPGKELFFEDAGFTKKDMTVNILIWHGKGYKEPLYLVTNLDFAPEIKRFYKKRFKIEPFFRDLKSKGFHIDRSGLRDPERLAKLLIAACLAYVLCIMAATKALKSKFYDLIDRTDMESLSLFQIGKRFIELLVDLRQWRAFSFKQDITKEQPLQYEDLFCVPF